MGRTEEVEGSDNDETGLLIGGDKAAKVKPIGIYPSGSTVSALVWNTATQHLVFCGNMEFG